MKKTMTFLTILLILFASCQSEGQEKSVHSRFVIAAKGLTERIIPQHANQIVFEEISRDNDNDIFELESRNGKIIIRGNNGVSMAMGFNWYLKEYCNCSVSLRGNNLKLPDKLPEINGVIRKLSWAKYRYYLNYCSFGYSMPWWDWSQWERLIDYMAMNGINTPLAVTGQEATWQAVCKRLGLDDEQVGKFLAGPPYLPFGWMGCLDGWGGPLPQSWIDRHEELGKKILARERELGMTPIQQGFTGHVPGALKSKFPDVKMHTINWKEWTTYLLDPMDPFFQKVANLFMEEQTKKFGTDHMYGADTFIEMNPPIGETDYLQNLSKAIYNGMSQTDPQAIWVLQSWAFSCQENLNFWTQPRMKAFFDGVSDEQMLCLDLVCEYNPMWNKTESFYGKPWLWCNIQNFGDKVFLGGSLDQLNKGVMVVKQDSAKGKLRGLGLVTEGLSYNPVVDDLMFEMAWRDKDVEIESWIKRYATYRYGKENKDAEQAWKILEETVYSRSGDFLSAMTRFPSLQKEKEVFFHNTRLADAWMHLLCASENLGKVDAYQFDLVNVSRQVLANYATVLHHKICKAYEEKDVKAFKVASKDFLQLLLDIDELVGTREELLLGKNLEDAKRWGTSPEEKTILEWNARRVLTLWGTTEINDYARKEWSGLISGYYYARWKKFLDSQEDSMATGIPFNEEKFRIELRNWMENWSDGKRTYPDKPKKSSVDISWKLWNKYGSEIITNK